MESTRKEQRLGLGRLPRKCPGGPEFEGGSKQWVGRDGQQEGGWAFWEEKAPLWVLPRFQSRVPTPWLSSPSKARLAGHPGNCKHSVQHHRLCTGPVTPSSSLVVAANVSSVRGSLRWCHGQGITSASSYRMYHLQRILSTIYSKNQKEKKKY